MTTNEKPGRIGGFDWRQKRPHAIAIYNAAYSPSGVPLWHGPRPWTVDGLGSILETFATHAEAIDYAFRQIPEPDPTPQDRETVTSGWQPKPDKEAAWKEKWELTR